LPVLTGPENERKLAGQPEKSAGILNEPPQNQGREQLRKIIVVDREE
jgi:hypothetical protein